MTEKKLTDKQAKFLDYLFSKFPKITQKTYEDAMKFAGYSEYTNLAEVANPLKDEIIERTKQALATIGPEAASNQVELMRNPKDKWWRAKLSIIEAILDRGGISPKMDEINASKPIGIIIMPAKKECQDQSNNQSVT